MNLTRHTSLDNYVVPLLSSMIDNHISKGEYIIYARVKEIVKFT